MNYFTCYNICKLSRIAIRGENDNEKYQSYEDIEKQNKKNVLFCKTMNLFIKT